MSPFREANSKISRSPTELNPVHNHEKKGNIIDNEGKFGFLKTNNGNQHYLKFFKNSENFMIKPCQ